VNPREFCRAREYSTVIGTTYNFNPFFFERIILPDLWFGHSGEVLVLGDGAELTHSINRCIGQTRFVGNKFIAEPVHLKGSFHPKILLKIGREGAKLMIGTGNMTSGGWGGNQELLSEWNLDKDEDTSAGIVSYILDSISPYVGSSLANQVFKRAREYDWLLGEPQVEEPNRILITKPNLSLSQALAERWEDYSFDTLKIFTGSTDKKGAFIEWCHQQFGIEECIVAVNPENVSFDPSALSSLPVEVSIAPVEDSKHLHAKFYYFEGPEKLAVIMGSANCSRRAWLLSPENGGNVEAIVVYDDVKKEDFDSILSRFPQEHYSAEKVVAGVKSEEVGDNRDVSIFKVQSLTLDRFQNELFVEFSTTLPEESLVKIDIAGESYELVPKNSEQTLWRTDIRVMPEGRETLFARIGILVGDNEYEITHWINDQDKLREASRRHRAVSAFDTFLKSETDTEHQKALKDLALIQSVLLDDPNLFSDPYYHPHKAEDQKEKSEEKEDAPPITAESLFKSMAEIEKESQGESILKGQISTEVSLMGIMKLFFRFSDEIHEGEEIQEEIETEEIGEDYEGKETREIEESTEVRKRNVGKKFRQKLIKQMDGYLKKLRSEEFRSSCTVLQLVQAAAYPVTVVVFGLRGGWIDSETAEEWLIAVTNILFHMQTGECSGIIEHVKNRYDQENRLEVFARTLGNGTLWVALLTGIGEADWQGKYGDLNRTILLKSVNEKQHLLSSSDPGRMALLIKQHRFQETAKWIGSEAIRLNKVLESIESLLKKDFNSYIQNQLEKEHLKGDMVYGKLGWGRVLDETVLIYNNKQQMKIYLYERATEAKFLAHGYYVNLRLAMENDNNFLNMVDKLKSTESKRKSYE